MKAFLFGGNSNGQTLNVENHLNVIMMPKDMQHISYDDIDIRTHSAIYRTEKYIKYTERFRKNLNSGGGVVEMEDLGIFIHESFSEREIESLSKIILMVIRAQWFPKKP